MSRTLMEHLHYNGAWQPFVPQMNLSDLEDVADQEHHQLRTLETLSHSFTRAAGPGPSRFAGTEFCRNLGRLV